MSLLTLSFIRIKTIWCKIYYTFYSCIDGISAYTYRIVQHIHVTDNYLLVQYFCSHVHAHLNMID